MTWVILEAWNMTKQTNSLSLLEFAMLYMLITGFPVIYEFACAPIETN